MMKTIIISFYFFGLFIWPLLGQGQNINAEQSKVSFKISNLGFNTVEGTISGMSGIVQFNPRDLSNAVFEVCVDATTINTGNDTRDEHLRAEDFFATTAHPNICFSSSSITKTKDAYIAWGQLSLKGVSKEIELPFTYDNQQLKGTLEVNRLDYNIGPSGGFMVGKTAELEIICTLK